MKAYMKEPNKMPVPVEITGADTEEQLLTMQMLVGGYIEAHKIYENFLGEEIVIVCNEEGRLMGLPYNFKVPKYDYFVGTVLVIGAVGEDFTDLPLEQIELKALMPYLFNTREIGHGKN